MHKILISAPRFPKSPHRGIPPPTPAPLVSNTLQQKRSPFYTAIIYTLGARIEVNLKINFRVICIETKLEGQAIVHKQWLAFSHSMIFVFVFFACQLSQRSVMAMMIIPLPHYDNLSGKYFEVREKKCRTIAPVPPPPPPPSGYASGYNREYAGTVSFRGDEVPCPNQGGGHFHIIICISFSQINDQIVNPLRSITIF